MKIYRYDSKNFETALRRAVNRMDPLAQAEIRDTVREIIRRVRAKGDAALKEYTRSLDGWRMTVKNMKVTPGEIEGAYSRVEAGAIRILKTSARRIRRFHLRQKDASWRYRDADGNLLGQRITPLENVGLYVPGGKAVYPSTVLMNAIPARVAGVRRIVAVSPAREGRLDPHLLVAAHIAGVREIYKIGGAQAVAALAFGTASVPRVDKIVGPGNIYVAEAKRTVFGAVGIDSIAGPSEILIIADDTGNPAFIAADLLSQAEHDERACSVLVTDCEALGLRVGKEIKRQRAELRRRAIAEKSLKKNGRIFIVKDLDMAVRVSNRFAPEHLELAVRSPQKTLKKIKNAGAVFLGHYTPEALGDYVAGPNHVLPTGGTARFFSPLGVYDFLKRTSLLSYSGTSLGKIGKTVMGFAELEGLEAHGKAVKVRLDERLSSKATPLFCRRA